MRFRKKNESILSLILDVKDKIIPYQNILFI